jgi:hypothetical protein
MRPRAPASRTAHKSQSDTDQQNPARQRSINETVDVRRRCPGSRALPWRRPAPACQLTSRTVTAGRRSGRPALGFEPLSVFAGFQEAAGAGSGLGITVFFFGVWRALAAELFHTRTDCRKIIGSAGSGHVSSSSLAEPRRGSWGLLRKAPAHAGAWAGLGQAKIKEPTRANFVLT